MEYEFNILYYINMYKKWCKSIVSLMAMVIFFVVILLRFVPVNYVSTVTIISADSGSESSASSVSRLLGFSTFGGGAYSNDVITAILQSNRMAKNIRSFLESNKKQNFSYSIKTRVVTAGLAIIVRGDDPIYTEKVANFAVQNLDAINSELNITASKPMVKVLDAASYGVKESRPIGRKVFVAGVATFLLMSLYIFISDYFKKLKTQQ